MLEIEDTIRTLTVGIGGFWMSLWETLPEIVRLGVGVATLVYLIIKIRREISEGKK